MFLRPLLGCLLATATAAPASTPTGDAALRGYVLGRYATADDRPQDAGRFFAAALGADPSQPLVTRRAFDSAVAAGDKPRAVALARKLTANGGGDSDIALVLLADGVNRRDWPAVTRARGAIASAGYAAVIEPIVSAWTLFAQGQPEKALALLDPAAFTGFARPYIAEQHAHMLAADGQHLAAAAAYAELRGSVRNGFALLRLGEADARAQGGARDAALALLEGDDPQLAAARERLLAGRRIGLLAPDAGHGLAWTMMRLAGDLSREQPVDLAVVFARVATFLAPDNAVTWLVLGDVLAANDQFDAMLPVLDMVRRDDPLFAMAQARRAEAFEALDRNGDAGGLLQAAAAARDARAGDWTRLADWHRRAERFDAAIAAYDRAIAMTEADGGEAWTLYFLRGSMKERAGAWPGAEADLRKALALSADEPIVLNYLGYSLLDRGLGGAEASAMIARAAKLRPADGGIIDSLGWSQFQAGQYADAVVSLEKAATLEPTDPTIADHLGDAYWQAGRRIEARFRWRAALALDPDEKLQKALVSKLDVGRDAALALQVAAQ
jgi:tetratricopeptide (TPR) repeat protein